VLPSYDIVGTSSQKKKAMKEVQQISFIKTKRKKKKNVTAR